jgi:hypothetical protein
LTCSSHELPLPATLDSKFAQSNPNEIKAFFVTYLKANDGFAKELIKDVNVAGQDKHGLLLGKVAAVEHSSDISPSAGVESRKVGEAASFQNSSCVSFTLGQLAGVKSGRGAISTLLYSWFIS